MFGSHQIFKALETIECGKLEVHQKGQPTRTFSGNTTGPHAKITNVQAQTFKTAAKQGWIGWANSYVSGDWHTPNLPNFLSFLLANSSTLKPYLCKQKSILTSFNIASVLGHTPNPSHTAPQYFDQPVDFFQSWLGQNPSFCCAKFEDSETSLEAACEQHLDHLLKKIGSRPHKCLDVGCGWGELIKYISSKSNCYIEGYTASQTQLNYARHQLTPHRKQTFVSLGTLEDITNVYDHIFSIEHINFCSKVRIPDYFNAIHSHLAQRGRASVQICVSDHKDLDTQLPHVALTSTKICSDFYIPSTYEIELGCADAKLDIIDHLDLGASHTQTIASWIQSFNVHSKDLLTQGFSSETLRLYEFWLASALAHARCNLTKVILIELKKAK